MKKLFVCLSILMLCASCGLQYERHGFYWQIWNHSEQTLKFKFPDPNSEDLNYREQEVKPNIYIYVEIYRYIVTGQSTVDFDYYFTKCRDLYGDDVCWEILSEDDVVLKTWSYSDYDQPNQRFFEQSSWSFYTDFGEWMFVPHHWIFEILPEDIEQ